MATIIRNYCAEFALEWSPVPGEYHDSMVGLVQTAQYGQVTSYDPYSTDLSYRLYQLGSKIARGRLPGGAGKEGRELYAKYANSQYQNGVEFQNYLIGKDLLWEVDPFGLFASALSFDGLDLSDDSEDSDGDNDTYGDSERKKTDKKKDAVGDFKSNRQDYWEAKPVISASDEQENNGVRNHQFGEINSVQDKVLPGHFTELNSLSWSFNAYEHSLIGRLDPADTQTNSPHFSTDCFSESESFINTELSLMVQASALFGDGISELVFQTIDQDEYACQLALADIAANF